MTKLVFALGLALVFTGSTFADDTPPLKIKAKRSDDRLGIKSEHDKVLFDVRSPFGISSATIERTTEQWPEKLVFQLRLKGLIPRVRPCFRFTIRTQLCENLSV